MKQFATYFTHGVRNGSKLRARSTRRTRPREILDRWMRSFSANSTAASPADEESSADHGWARASAIRGPAAGPASCAMAASTREMYGSEPQTTNNRMELTAAVEGLRALKEPCEVEIVTDSEVPQERHHGVDPRWKTNGWRTGGKEAGGRTRICGTSWTSRSAGTNHAGPGPRATHRTPTTTAATNWRRPRRGGRFRASADRTPVARSTRRAWPAVAKTNDFEFGPPFASATAWRKSRRLLCTSFRWRCCCC